MKLRRILARLRPWIWRDSPQAPPAYGISIKIPWKDRKPKARPKDSQDGL